MAIQTEMKNQEVLEAKKQKPHALSQKGPELIRDNTKPEPEPEAKKSVKPEIVAKEIKKKEQLLKSKEKIELNVNASKNALEKHAEHV